MFIYRLAGWLIWAANGQLRALRKRRQAADYLLVKEALGQLAAHLPAAMSAQA